MQQEPLEALRKLVAATGTLPPDRLMLEHVTFDGDVEEGTGLSSRRPSFSSAGTPMTSRA
jgi:hypothetical protein